MSEKYFDLKEVLTRHFAPSLAMLERIIAQCPNELWNEVNGGFPFWQQIFHAYESIDYWIRKTEDDYQEPKYDKDVTFDLDKTCTDFLTKEEIITYAKKIREKVEKYFMDLEGQNLLKSDNNNKFSHYDIMLCQIRHIQYHIGHCNAILRQNNYKAVDWIGYGED
jgi:hypothetical protein